MAQMTLVFFALFTLYLTDARIAFAEVSAYAKVTSVPSWLNTARPLKASDLKGRIVLLDFWTYCCINCIHVMPDLKALEDEFKDKLTVIGVHSAKFTNEKDSDNIRNAILRYGLTHPVVNDAQFSIWNAFHVHAWPTFILIDPEGRIVLAAGGEGQRARFHDAIAELIKKYGPENQGAKGTGESGKINTKPLPIALEKDKVVPTALQFPGKLAYAAQFRGAPALFISDSSNHRIVAINLAGEILMSVGQKARAGSRDGGLSEAQFNKPQGLVYDQNLLYVADTGNNELRVIDFNSNKVSTLAGTGDQGEVLRTDGAPALKAALNSPWALAFSQDKKNLFVAMAGDHQIWTYNIGAKTLSPAAGDGRENIRDGVYPQNSLAQTSGLSLLKETLYFVDAETSSLRKLRAGDVTTLIGSGLFDFGPEDGKLGVGRLQHPLGVAATPNAVYIADAYNQAIRKYDLKTNELSTVAGKNGHGKTDGLFAKAQFNEPNDILIVDAHSESPDVAYVTDTNNGLIRRLDFKSAMVTTVDVHEKGQAFTPEISTQLPNLTAHNLITVPGMAPVTVELHLDRGWHINELAPSQLSLFDVTKKKPLFVRQFSRDELSRGAVQLPPLAQKKKYRLQGIFYFCETKDGAACLIQSHDQTIAVGGVHGGADSERATPVMISFLLKTPKAE